MKRITLTHTRHSCRSRAEDRYRAQVVRAALHAAKPHPESSLHVFQALLPLPLGARQIDALRKLPHGVLVKSRQLEICTRRPSRKIVVINPFHGIVTDAAVASFQDLPRRSNMARLWSDLSASAFSRIEWDEFLELWEAGLPIVQGSLPTAIATSRFQGAMPAIIDLQMNEIPSLGRRRRGRERHSCDPFDTLRDTLRDRRRGAHDLDARGRPINPLSKMLQREVCRADHDGDPLLVAALISIERVANAARSRPSPSSLTRIIAAAKRLYLLARSGTLRSLLDSNALQFSSRDVSAYRQFCSQLPRPHLKSLDLPESVSRTRNPARGYALVRPELYAACYGIGDAPADPTDNLKRAALRVLSAVLVHTGRRASCLVGLTSSHFGIFPDSVAGGRFVSLRIPSSKVDSEINAPIPIDLLWPTEEIDHLEAFLDHPSVRHNPHQTLLATAGIGRLSKRNKDLAQQRIANRLAEFGLQNIQRSTHRARTTWATWWPIRVLCCREPWLLDEVRWLSPLRVHPWFQPDALARLGALVGDMHVDSINVGRQIMGMGSPAEFIKSYCRSWPLVMHLQSFILWRQGRCPLRPSDPIL